MNARPRSLTAGVRIVAAAFAIALLCLTLSACGGGGKVSETLPKSTGEITPPNDTSAEKEAAKTSLSTTSTSSKTTTSGRAGSEAGTEAETAEETPTAEAEREKAVTPEGGTSAGTTPANEEGTGEAAKGTGTASPTGGATAP